jgi:hypothetical protein
MFCKNSYFVGTFLWERYSKTQSVLHAQVRSAGLVYLFQDTCTA